MNQIDFMTMSKRALRSYISKHYNERITLADVSITKYAHGAGHQSITAFVPTHSSSIFEIKFDHVQKAYVVHEFSKIAEDALTSEYVLATN
jgi:hypothetical protein